MAAVSAVTSDTATDAKAVADKTRDEKLKKKIAELIAADQLVKATTSALAAAVKAQTDPPTPDDIAAVSAAKENNDKALAAWSALVKATRDSAAIARAKIVAAARGDKKGKFELGWSQWTILVTVLVLALAQIIRMFMKLSKNPQVGK
jgi:hypothetical protein